MEHTIKTLKKILEIEDTMKLYMTLQRYEDHGNKFLKKYPPTKEFNILITEINKRNIVQFYWNGAQEATRHFKLKNYEDMKKYNEIGVEELRKLDRDLEDFNYNYDYDKILNEAEEEDYAELYHFFGFIRDRKRTAIVVNKLESTGRHRPCHREPRINMMSNRKVSHNTPMGEFCILFGQFKTNKEIEREEEAAWDD